MPREETFLLKIDFKVEGKTSFLAKRQEGYHTIYFHYMSKERKNYPESQIRHT